MQRGLILLVGLTLDRLTFGVGFAFLIGGLSFPSRLSDWWMMRQAQKLPRSCKGRPWCNMIGAHKMKFTRHETSRITGDASMSDAGTIKRASNPWAFARGVLQD